MAITSVSVEQRPEHRRSTLWFALWALVGAGGSLGLLAILTIGIFLIPVALLGLALLVRRGTRNDHVWRGLGGLAAGAAAPLLLIAYLNRQGSGTVCTTRGDATSCVDEWSPWPFLAIATLLIGVSIAVTILINRRSVRVPADAHRASPWTPPSADPTGGRSSDR